MGLLGFISWFVLGFVGGIIFARKGYHPHVGIAIGILFGPFALVLCLLLPTTASGRKQAQLEAQMAADEYMASGTKACPKCRRTVGVMSRFCPRCNHRFESDDVAGAA